MVYVATSFGNFTFGVVFIGEEFREMLFLGSFCSKWKQKGSYNLQFSART